MGVGNIAPSIAVASTTISKFKLGTAIARAFPHSPMSLAYAYPDLQKAPNGRFFLGLWTWHTGEMSLRTSLQHQVGFTWAYAKRSILISGCYLGQPAEWHQARLSGPVLSVHADDIRAVRFTSRGDLYICHPAVGLCDGFHAHPFHSAK